MNASPQPNEDPSPPHQRPPHAGRRGGAEPTYRSVTSREEFGLLVRSMVDSARGDLLAAAVHARLNPHQGGPHRVVLKRQPLTDAHAHDRMRQILVLWFADHPRAAEEYLRPHAGRATRERGLAALAADRADRDLAQPAGACIRVDTAAGAALLAARLTDGVPAHSLGAELTADAGAGAIPTHVLALGSRPRVLEAASEQLTDLHHERRLQAAGLVPAQPIGALIQQLPMLAAWVRFGRALRLDAIDHRELARTTQLFLNAADGAPKGRLGGRVNGIVHPDPHPIDAPIVRRVASSGTAWDPELDGREPPRPLAVLLDQVIGGLSRARTQSAGITPPPRIRAPPGAAEGDDGNADPGARPRP